MLALRCVKIKSIDNKIIMVKIKISKIFSSENTKGYLERKKYILDISSGPKSSYWWSFVDKDAKVVGVDNLFFLKKNTKEGENI